MSDFHGLDAIRASGVYIEGYHVPELYIIAEYQISVKMR